MRHATLILCFLHIHVCSADAPIHFINEFCIKCHNEKKPKGNIRLDQLNNESALMRSRDTLENAWKRVLNQEMPPDDSPQPNAAQREAIVECLEKTIKPENLDALVKIDRFYIQRFGYLVRKLAAIPEGEKTLLDHTLILYGSPLCDGIVNPGRLLNFTKETPLANLHISMLHGVSVNERLFCESTGRGLT